MMQVSYSVAIVMVVTTPPVYLQVEEKPDVTYNDVGGCKEQIEKLKEVVETPLLHVRSELEGGGEAAPFEGKGSYMHTSAGREKKFFLPPLKLYQQFRTFALLA